MNLHVTPLGVAAVGVAWILIACALATVPHRMKRAIAHADPGEDQPDEIALMRAEFDRIVTGDWFDGALHYTGHGHEGDAL